MATIYKIPASCKIGLISTSKGIFKINENLSQADRKYLHEAGFMKFDIQKVIQRGEANEGQKQETNTESRTAQTEE